MAKKRNVLTAVRDFLRSSMGMDSDSSYNSFRDGFYLSGKNIRHTTQQGSTGNDIQNILGNTLKFVIDDVTTQQQQTTFLFTINSVSNETFTIGISDWNGTSLMANLTFTTDHTSISNTLTNFITAIQSALTTGNQTSTVTDTDITGTDSGYVTLTITGTVSPAKVIVGRAWSSFYYDVTILTGTETGALITNEPFTSTNGVTGFIGTNVSSTVISVYGLNKSIVIGDVITGTNSTKVFTVIGVDAGADTPSNYHSEIIYEAIDVSITGTPVNIGSYDILGRLWSFWSPQINAPTALDNVFSVSNASGNFELTFTLPHGIINGEAIAITGVSGTTTAINGYWVVNVVSANILILLGSVYSSGAVVTSATITQYPFGYGMISGEERDENTQNYSGAIVLRSKELGFRVAWQIDVDCDLTDKYDTYFTDNENVPRVFYYTGALVLDGAINALNAAGEYSYGSIDLATQLIVAQPKIQLRFTGQLQTGGNILAGNHRASVRLVTIAGNTPTLWTALDNPVPVYKFPFNDSVCEYVVGDDPLQFTTKINQYQVTGIDTSVYKYLDLADILYSGAVVSGIIVTRYVITNSTMDIQYSGYENDTVPLDISTLGQVQANYATARNVRILDNRLVLSNLTSSIPYDLSAWALTIEHELFKKELDFAPDPVGNASGFFQPEFSSPDNVNEFVGYMINDIYRFGVQVRDKFTGVWSDAFFVQDIVFNTDGSVPRRIAPLSDNTITDDLVAATSGVNDNGATAQVLVPAIRFSYNTNYILTNGKRLGDVIDGVRFVRAECIPEIIASGWVIQTIKGLVTNNNGTWISNFGNTTGYYSEYPLWTGWSLGDGGRPFTENFDFLGSSPAFPDSFTTDSTSKKLCAFYSPDLFFNTNPFNVGAANGDALLVIAEPSTMYVNAACHNPHAVGSTLRYLDCAVSRADSYSIDESVFVSNTSPISAITYAKTLNATSQAILPTDPSYTFQWIEFATPVFHVTADITPITGGYGAMYGQWYRAIPNKYGNPNATKYITTGHIRDLLPQDTGTLTDDVYGGDTFTQHTYIKVRIQQRWLAGVAPNQVAQPLDAEGGGGGIRMCTQNRLNTQMRSISAQTPPSRLTVFPNQYEPLQNGSDLWTAKVFSFVENSAYDTLEYTSSYNIQNNVINYVGFDPLIERITNYLARVAWSVLKPQGSISDLFRVFLPFDFHDLESKYGGITHMEVINGELLTLQIRKWMRQYFNARGTLQVSGVGEIVVGDGSVMSRDGVQLSAIGTRHKWSCVKGKAQGGSDTLYWWSSDFKKFMRFGADGTKPISDVNYFQSFAANNTQFVFNFDTPALNYGVIGVWDDRNNEVVWTFKGQKQPPTIIT